MVHDIYHWRLQTVIAVIARYSLMSTLAERSLTCGSLPGTPLWIAALYSDKMAKINKYWVSPMWYVELSIFATVTVG